MEKDGEIGEGNYTTHFRALDTRIGRWLSIDPVTRPELSPYNSMDNNPILLTDPDGDCPMCLIPVVVGGLMLAATPVQNPTGDLEKDKIGAQKFEEARNNQSMMFTSALAMGAWGGIGMYTSRTVLAESGIKVITHTTVKAAYNTINYQMFGSAAANVYRYNTGGDLSFGSDIDYADAGAAGVISHVPMPIYAKAIAEVLFGVLVDIDGNGNMVFITGKLSENPAKVGIELLAGSGGIVMKKYLYGTSELIEDLGVTDKMGKELGKLDLIADFMIKGEEGLGKAVVDDLKKGMEDEE